MPSPATDLDMIHSMAEKILDAPCMTTCHLILVHGYWWLVRFVFFALSSPPCIYVYICLCAVFSQTPPSINQLLVYNYIYSTTVWPISPLLLIFRRQFQTAILLMVVICIWGCERSSRHPSPCTSGANLDNPKYGVSSTWCHACFQAKMSGCGNRRCKALVGKLAARTILAVYTGPSAISNIVLWEKWRTEWPVARPSSHHSS